MRRLLAPLVLALAAGCAVHHTDVIACVSDLHLGDPRSILDDDAGRQVFLGAIRNAVQTGGVKTLVLDGDVLELSLASETSAYDAARPLFAGLAQIQGLDRVVVVVGNHDHRLWEQIPGDAKDKLDVPLDAGTALHEQMKDVLGSLKLTVVYPDFEVDVPHGHVHFTHGHYFDAATTPWFDPPPPAPGATPDPVGALVAIESRDAGWFTVITAGGEDPELRAAYRGVYHVSQHVTRLLDVVFHRDQVDVVPWKQHTVERAKLYLEDVLDDPQTVALVTGHTHESGGFETTIDAFGGKPVELYDVGAFVAGHHDRPVKPYLFLLDPHRGDMTMTLIDVPPDVVKAAHDRSFAHVP